MPIRLFATVAILLASAAFAGAQEAPKLRPLPDVFLRERTPAAVIEDNARAAITTCVRKGKLDPAALDTPECVKARSEWDAIVRKNDADELARKRK